MINNTASRKTLAAVLAVGMAAGLTGCGSTVAANTNDYFIFPQVRRTTKVKLAELGNDAGIIGAASLAYSIDK